MTRPTTDTADLSDTALDRCGRTDDDTIKQADRIPASPATVDRITSHGPVAGADHGSLGGVRSVAEPEPKPFPLELVLLDMFIFVVGFAAGVVVAGVR